MILSDLKGKINASGKIGGIVGNSANIKGRIIRGAGGTTNYEELENLPAFNDIVIEGNKDPHDYGIAKLTDIPVIPTPPEYNLIKTNLWSYATDNNNNIIYGNWDVTLHDDIDNYDIIILEVASFIDDMNPGNAWNGSTFITLFPHLLNNAYYPNRFNICSYDQRSTNIEMKDNRCRVMINSGGNNNGLISVWGVKLGAIV